MGSATVDLISAVKAGDASRVSECLKADADVDQQDDQGWAPLSWAAGRGDAEVVRLLLERGADVTKTGRDQRTPLMIARAAGHAEAATILSEAEKARGVWEDPRETRPYCKAYYLESLRRWEDWPEANGDQDHGTDAEGTAAEDEAETEGPLTDQSIVYVHEDFTVTRSMWHGEDVVFENVTPQWRNFCEKELKFAVPEDLA